MLWDDRRVLSAQRYRYLARPRVDAHEPHALGVNCRSLIQDYYWDQHGQWFSRDDVEQPGLWEQTGAFLDLRDADGVAQLSSLPHETVLLAERIRDAAGQSISRGPECFPDVDHYRFQLHTALLLDPRRTPLDDVVSTEVVRRAITPGQLVILHATAVEGGTCLWGLEAFIEHYRLVAAKCLTASPDDGRRGEDRPNGVSGE